MGRCSLVQNMLCWCQLLPSVLKNRLQECLPEALMVHKWSSSSSEVIHFRACALLRKGKATRFICSVPAWQCWWDRKSPTISHALRRYLLKQTCSRAATKQNAKHFATEPSRMLLEWQTYNRSPGYWSPISISVKKTFTSFREKEKSIALNNCNQGSMSCIQVKEEENWDSWCAIFIIFA